ncbi:MAG: hypothetical protein J0L99_17660 [Chitinophagales bacterium]|nr:hypothetical protein [Chitinophagales bacterium]
MLKHLPLVVSLIATFVLPLQAQQQFVTYAGSNENEAFTDVVQLSNGHYLVSGVADNLDWLPAGTPRIALQTPPIPNNQGNNRIAFLLEFNQSLQEILGIYFLPANAAQDIRHIKLSNAPGEKTGAVYLSGDTDDSNNGGYFIARLNENFVDAKPTGLAWARSVKAQKDAYPDQYRPWDVGPDGTVVFAAGDSHAYNWSAIYALDSLGQDKLMPNWRVHWISGGGEYYGAADTYSGANPLAYSGIVFKRDGNRCELRSTNLQDYDLWQPDGNGGMKKGRWPLDVLFKAPCTPGVSGNTTSGPGYSGYSPPGTFTYGPQAICIDRRNGDMYIGFNAKSVLPDGNPDFEPAVMAMRADGALRWWSRLYHEVNPAGDTLVSTPDQYVDALAIDYKNDLLVVNARAHGNNVENLWEGNKIAANPAASGFQNNFTGSSGNIHLSWLGKLQCADGVLRHSTYIGEFAEGATGLGAAHPDPNLDSWPNPNVGWPTLNTTYLGKNRLKVSADGSVLVLGKGRRTITTANAYQKMVKPGNGGLSCWNEFVRLYTPDLSKPLYSSLLVGAWDTLTQAGGDNVRLMGVWKTDSALLVVGMHTGAGAQLPVQATPAWGQTQYAGQSAVLACLRAGNFVNPADGPVGGNTSSTQAVRDFAAFFRIYPNPAGSATPVQVENLYHSDAVYRVVNIVGQTLAQGVLPAGQTLRLDAGMQQPGWYGVQVLAAGQTVVLPFLRL